MDTKSQNAPFRITIIAILLLLIHCKFAPDAAGQRAAFVEIDQSGDLAYSYDGIRWTFNSTALPSTAGWGAVAYGNGVFVAISQEDSVAAYSYDGIHWNSSPGLPAGYYWPSLSYGNNTFVTIGCGNANAAYSHDGINWTASPDGIPDNSWTSVTYGANMFVATAAWGTSVEYSYDGITWATGSGTFPNQAWTGIVYGKGTFVMAGLYDTGASGYSSDGINWTTSFTELPEDWWSLAYGNDVFVAIGNYGESEYSGDGINWTSGPGMDGNGNGMPLNLAAYGTGLFVAAGGSSCSSDGINWTYSPGLGGDAVSIAARQPDGYITNGMVAYWKFYDGIGASAIDSSGNNITLPLAGSPSWGNNDIIFNGTNQYGNVTNSALDALDQHDLTVCAWLYQDEPGHQGIVNKYGTGGWSFQVLDNNQLDMFVEGGEDIINNGGGTVPIGQWVFVTMVWHYASGNNHADFYFDGISDSSVYNGAAVESTSSGAPMQVGAIFPETNYAFNGCMHDVAIYNRALSSNEVQSNYLQSEFITSVPYPDLLYYKMTEYPDMAPFALVDSSTHGGTPGEVLGTNLVWATNVAYIPNTALHFHGESGDDNYIDTSNSVLFNFTTNLFTINLWVDTDSSPSHYFIHNQDSSETNGWYLNCDSSLNLYFGTVTNGTGYSVEQPRGVGNNAWTMVTVVRTSLTNATIYWNGGYPVSGHIESPSSSSGTLKLALDPTGANFLDGNIWLTQIWSTNLSQSDVANLYLNQLSGSPWP